MEIVVFIYDGFTALDAVGPYEVLSRLPGAKVRFAAEQAGVLRTDVGALGVVADVSISDIESADVLVVPGGLGARQLIGKPSLNDWLTKIDATSQWTTSVCTGSLLLASAGLLDGLPATTHWSAFDTLAELGAVPTEERVIFAGKRATSAGVSSGIDMALRLAERVGGPELAQLIQLGIEYDPDPPFDSGSITKAPEAIVRLARSLF